ncbi:MAG: hypothetical protein A2Z44_10120 [Betaproteobacteria bacterium RBG_19FT_COMBO_58_11]|nr:MAG: hypothetical protein A2Z44_10120 [Betaproteobacteria bacterium RBG_19FT_COMBO_58_11]
MQKHLLIAVAVAGMLSLAGCQSAPPAPAKAELNDEAKIALAWAESDVKTAQSQGALWTTAANALKAAKEAAAKGDSAAVIKNAKTASTHAKLGIEQKKLPLLTLGK